MLSREACPARIRLRLPLIVFLIEGSDSLELRLCPFFLVGGVSVIGFFSLSFSLSFSLFRLESMETRSGNETMSLARRSRGESKVGLDWTRVKATVGCSVSWRGSLSSPNGDAGGDSEEEKLRSSGVTALAEFPSDRDERERGLVRGFFRRLLGERAPS